MVSAGAGNDVIEGGPGGDLLAGGLGADTFVYKSVADRGDIITDFSAAQGDRVDLSSLFAGSAATQRELLAGGYVKLADTGSGTWLYVDPDGSVGPGGAVALVKLSGVPVASVQTHDVLTG